MITRALFTRYVKDALDNYYDPIQLEIHPLVDALVSPHTPTETRGQALRQVLAEAVNALRPPESVPLGQPEWLGYRVLRLRYIDSLTPSEVCQEVGIGQTSFYRYHGQALEAVVSILWRTYQRHLSPSREANREPTKHTGTESAREEAIRAARSSHYTWVHPGALVESIMLTIAPLAQQRGIDLLFDVSPSLPPVRGDLAILRQIVLCVLNEGIRLAGGGGLRFAVGLLDDEFIWRLGGLDESKVRERDMEELTGLIVARSLLNAYGGRLWSERLGLQGLTLCFALPVARPKTVLVVDDNPDTAGLYCRYLEAQQLAVRAANTVDQMWVLLAEAKPALVLLDLLMPEQDGWDVLQRLKAMPEMATVPVVVCSVLTQPDLALALGAKAVLQKPIERQDLIRTVQELLDGQDSAA